MGGEIRVEEMEVEGSGQPERVKKDSRKREGQGRRTKGGAIVNHECSERFGSWDIILGTQRVSSVILVNVNPP